MCFGARARAPDDDGSLGVAGIADEGAYYTGPRRGPEGAGEGDGNKRRDQASSRTVPREM